VIAHLLDRWPGMVYVRDLVQERDIYLNESARQQQRAAGGSESEPPRFETLLHPDDLDGATPWLARLAGLRDGEVITRRIRLRGAGGVYRSFRDRESVIARSVAGNPTRVLAVIEDAPDA
jgi:hypothetical protein